MNTTCVCMRVFMFKQYTAYLNTLDVELGFDYIRFSRNY